MRKLGSTMRIFRPYPNVLAFYDGRIEGVRAYGAEPNWLDDGAFELGICTYAIVDGSEAIVYDAHISVPHARIIRRVLEEAGVTSMQLVLSHWHADHVAGNEVFADCEIIANRLTAELLAANWQDFEEKKKPAIKPLVQPNRIFDDFLVLKVGGLAIELHCADIHSRDGTVLLLPEARLLFAGDTLEDPITYVAEPGRLPNHLLGLDRLSKLDFERILPNHGASEIVETGGYDRRLLDATRSYVENLLKMNGADAGVQPLNDFIGQEIAAGGVFYFEPYERVHQNNVRAILAARSNRP